MSLSGYITLDEAKDQVAIERSNPDLDARLTRLLDASERAAENFLGAPLTDFEDSPAQSPPTIPEAIKSGVLLQLEAEFDRDERTMDKLLDRARDLLWPYRINVGV